MCIRDRPPCVTPRPTCNTPIEFLAIYLDAFRASQKYGIWTVSKSVFEGENRAFSGRFEQGRGREGYISQNLNIGKNKFYIGQNR